VGCSSSTVLSLPIALRAFIELHLLKLNTNKFLVNQTFIFH